VNFDRFRQSVISMLTDARVHYATAEDDS